MLRLKGLKRILQVGLVALCLVGFNAYGNDEIDILKLCGKEIKELADKREELAEKHNEFNNKSNELGKKYDELVDKYKTENPENDFSPYIKKLLNKANELGNKSDELVSRYNELLNKDDKLEKCQQIQQSYDILQQAYDMEEQRYDMLQHLYEFVQAHIKTGKKISMTIKEYDKYKITDRGLMYDNPAKAFELMEKMGKILAEVKESDKQKIKKTDDLIKKADDLIEKAK